jgi:glutathione S-transferase
MIKLYRAGRFETLGDVSPFVYKLETWLRMANIPFENEIMPVAQLLQEGPRNLIPFIDINGERIGDSSLIIAQLQKSHDDPLADRRLTPDQLALGTLIKSLCEHELFYTMIYGRWLDGNYKPLGRFLTSFLPEDQQEAAIEASLESVKSMLHGYRLGRYGQEFVRSGLRTKLDALSNLLGSSRWLFGDRPSTYDAGLYAILASTIHFPVPNPHVEIAREYTSLVDYCDRIKTVYFASEDWTHAQ